MEPVTPPPGTTKNSDEKEEIVGRKYECVVCHLEAMRRCPTCGAHVHPQCMAAHHRASPFLHKVSPLEKRVIARVDPEATQSEEFVAAMDLEVDDHDAALDLLGGDWPEAWPTTDIRLLGLRNGEQFCRAFSATG